MSDDGIRALIVAFDDVLMATHALRAEALRDACGAEGVLLDWPWIVEATRHQRLGDVVSTGLPGTADDPARGTLIGLRADAQFARAVVERPVLDPEVVARISETTARGGRVIIRSDTAREVVTRVLGSTGLMDQLAFLVCTEDAGVPNWSVAWQRIDERLQRVGIGVTARAALEVHPDARQCAAPFVAQLVPWNPVLFPSLRPS